MPCAVPVRPPPSPVPSAQPAPADEIAAASIDSTRRGAWCNASRVAAWAACLAIVAAGTWRACAADVRELAANLQDDSFYYLLPAFRAWQNGGVLTFDGEHPMFGVQPAFALLLTLLAGCCDGRETFFRAALVMAHMLYAATALLLGACVRERLAATGNRLRASIAGDLACVVLALDIPVLFGFTTLKENVLYAPLLLLAWRSAGRLTAGSGDGARGGRFGCGVLLGLGVATRLTPGSLLLAGALAWIAARGRWRRSIVVAAGGAAAMAPFALYGLLTVGRALPTSGTIKMAAFGRALADGTYWQHFGDYVAAVPAYLFDVLRYAVGLPHGFHVPQDPPPPHLAGPVIAALVGCGLVVAWRRTRRSRESFATQLLVLVMLDCVGHVATPLLLLPHGLVDYYQWYVAGMPALLAAAAALAATIVSPRVAAVSVVALGAAASAQALLQVRPAPFHTDDRSWARQMIVATERMNELLSPGARVAAANAGCLGYFAREDLVVVNIDGLANDDWVTASRVGTPLHEYLQRERIGYVCDVPTADGIAGSLFDRATPLAVVPFRGQDYDGYFLVRRDGDAYPEFWPHRGPRTGTAHPAQRAVIAVPWVEAGALPALAAAPSWTRLASGQVGAWRSFVMPAGVAEGPVFYAGGGFASFSAAVGGADGRLAIVSEGRELAAVTSRGDAWTPLQVDLGDAARIELVFTPAAGERRDLWVADTRWSVATAIAPGEAGVLPFGHGCSHDGGQVPRLVADGPPVAGQKLRLHLTQCAAANGLLAIASRSAARLMGSAEDRDACYTWTAADALLVVQPFVVEGGAATVEIQLPPDLPSGRYVAQAVLGIDSAHAALSNGLSLATAR